MSGIGDDATRGESGIEDCLRANAQFAADYTDEDRPPQPTRRLAIVTCMDVRIDPTTCFGVRDGDAHVIRNAGGVVTDDVIRSLALSQSALGTREVMVIQHTECGVCAPDAELADAVEGATGSRPDFALGGFTDAEAEVRASVRRLRESPYLPARDAIRGFIYDVRTGALTEVEPAPA